MSSKSKGNAFEVKVRKYLEANGFTVDRARATLKRLFIPGKAPMFVSGANDFFGCADLVGVHPAKGYTLFVQCFASQDSGGLAHRKRKLEKIPWNLPTQRVQLWQTTKTRGHIKVHELLPVVGGDRAWVDETFRPVTGEGAPVGIL